MLVVIILSLLFMALLMLSHYWQHPEQLPYTALQQIQQWSQQEQVSEVCRSGSFLSSSSCSSSGSGCFPLEQQLVSQVCGWVHKAANVLPPDAAYSYHDEF
jgi:hypothetical protein